jgi:threonyl-tRNA synthetase
MYSPLDMTGTVFSKPMNCTYPYLYLSNAIRSFQQFPISLWQEGTFYRYERSGELHGLMRGARFQPDDGPSFLPSDQMQMRSNYVLRFRCCYFYASLVFKEIQRLPTGHHARKSSEKPESCGYAAEIGI